MMELQLIAPTVATTPAMQCSSFQMQLLLYQFLLHVQPHVDTSCVESLKHVLQENNDESNRHQLQKCEQEVKNLTSMHFMHLIAVNKNWERIEHDHAVEISKYTDHIQVLNKELKQYKMKLQVRNISVLSPAAATTQISSEVGCEEDATVEKLNQGLVHAVSVGNLSSAISYLDCGADPNTTVHLAAFYGLSEIVQLLLDRGADVDLARKNDKWTPLHVAVQYGHVNVVRLLLSKGVDTNVGRNDKCTALYQASSLGNVQIVQLLLQFNANTELKCANGSTPLHAAAVNNCVNVASVLLEHGADVDGIDNKSRTGIYLAAKNGNLEIVKLLIQHGVNVQISKLNGMNALHAASAYNHKKIVQALLEAGADINVRDRKYGVTALHYAAHFGHLEVARVLVDKGADLKQSVEHFGTPRDTAVAQGKVEVAEFLASVGG